MLGPTTGVVLLVVALATFAAYAVIGARRLGAGERDRYLSARGTHGSRTLAVSFFASALGTWILLVPPQVGTAAGALGIGGYAVGQAAAVAILAWLGPRVAAEAPSATTLLGFVRERFGRLLQAYAGAVSVLYMFVFLTVELTAIGLVLSLLAGIEPLIPIIAVAVATAAYTAYGGLPASIATDRLQGWLILGLVAAAAAAVAVRLGNVGELAAAGGLWTVTRAGAEGGATLIIAVVAANLFHMGYWQRVWAARDRTSLIRGALAGGLLIVPVLVLTGAAGALAAGAGLADDPSVAFFALLPGLPAFALAAVAILAVSLVASTVDTLQNALTALVAADVAGGRLRLGSARVVTVALTIPAAAIALAGLSVLRLFLIADLLAATLVVPVFLGLWKRVTPAAALAGAIGGLLGVVVLGWLTEGSIGQGLLLLTLPRELELAPFVVAPLASAAVTLAVSAVRGAER
jgi:SSS family solute:Na+ symporter